MARPKALPTIPTAQLLAVLVLSLAIYLIVEYGRRGSADYYVSQAEKEAQALIDAELATQQELLERKKLVESPEYAEKWAREDAHMIKPGDQPVILVMVDSPANPDAPVRPVETRGAEEQPTSNWNEWWGLFFDTDPGLVAVR